MKTIVVTNKKGGVGKSTLSIHLAHYAAEEGARVLVVDLDDQANATYVLEDYATGIKASALFQAAPLTIPSSDRNIDLISADPALADLDRGSLQAADQLDAHLTALSPSYDLCILDTPPTAALRQVAALKAADYAVAPIELEQFSIQGIRAMLQVIYGVKQRFNPKLTFVGMVPNRFNAHAPAHKANLKQLLQENPTLVIPCPITLRSSIGEAATARVPVWKYGKTTAREAGKEVKAACAAIFQRIGGIRE